MNRADVIAILVELFFRSFIKQKKSLSRLARKQERKRVKKNTNNFINKKVTLFSIHTFDFFQDGNDKPKVLIFSKRNFQSTKIKRNQR